MGLTNNHPLVDSSFEICKISDDPLVWFWFFRILQCIMKMLMSIYSEPFISSRSGQNHGRCFNYEYVYHLVYDLWPYFTSLISANLNAENQSFFDSKSPPQISFLPNELVNGGDWQQSVFLPLGLLKRWRVTKMHCVDMSNIYFYIILPQKTWKTLSFLETHPPR